MSTLIQCQNLSKTYKNKKALIDLNVSIESGKIVGLLGPNGSGKTTLIKILAGLLTTSSGTASVNGKPIGIETKKLVSYLPDKEFLNRREKVNHYIQVYKDFYPDFSEKTALEMLASLGINPMAKISTLSKGNCEKVALILTMSRKASVYILDEPIAGVDPATRDYILRTILQNYNEEASILLSTHLISDIENILSDAIFIKEGQITIQGNVDDIRAEHGKSLDQLFREVFSC